MHFRILGPGHIQGSWEQALRHFHPRSLNCGASFEFLKPSVAEPCSLLQIFQSFECTESVPDQGGGSEALPSHNLGDAIGGLQRHVLDAAGHGGQCGHHCPPGRTLPRRRLRFAARGVAWGAVSKRQQSTTMQPTLRLVSESFDKAADAAKRRLTLSW